MCRGSAYQAPPIVILRDAQQASFLLIDANYHTQKSFSLDTETLNLLKLTFIGYWFVLVN